MNLVRMNGGESEDGPAMQAAVYNEGGEIEGNEDTLTYADECFADETSPTDTVITEEQCRETTLPDLQDAHFLVESFDADPAGNIYLCQDGQEPMVIELNSGLETTDERTLTLSLSSEQASLLNQRSQNVTEQNLDDDSGVNAAENLEFSDAGGTEMNAGASNGRKTNNQAMRYILVVNSNPSDSSYSQLAQIAPSTSQPSTSEAEEQDLVINTLISVESNDAQFPCPNCKFTTNRKQSMLRHLKSHTNAVKRHKCPICSKLYKSANSLNNHLNIHSGVRPHKCQSCDSAFTTSGELVRHARYKHTFEKPHKCSECDYSAVELSKLKRHMKSHTGERPFNCDQCTYASPDMYKLRRHMRIHTGEKPFICETCDARFTQSNSLKSHRRIHNGSKPKHRCQLCPTSCGRRSDLKVHIQNQHSSDSRYAWTCKKCSAEYTDRHSYKLHTRLHEGEAAYKCEDCAFSSLHQSKVADHALTNHDDLTKYQCDREGCTEKFRFRFSLKHHEMFTHKKIPYESVNKHFICSCSKHFRIKENMAKHTELHDPQSLLHGNKYADQLITQCDETGDNINAHLISEIRLLETEPPDSATTSQSETTNSTSLKSHSGSKDMLSDTSDYRSMSSQKKLRDSLVLKKVLQRVDGRDVAMMELSDEHDNGMAGENVDNASSSHISECDITYSVSHDILYNSNQHEEITATADQISDQRSLTEISSNHELTNADLSGHSAVVTEVLNIEHLDHNIHTQRELQEEDDSIIN